MEQRISLNDFTSTVRDLFTGYPQLLLGFNTFLPDHCKIALPFNYPRCAKEFEAAVRFFVKVKAAVCFKERQDLLEDLIHLMSDCSEGPYQQHFVSGRYVSTVGASVGSLSQLSIDELKIQLVMPTGIIRQCDVNQYLYRVKYAFGYDQGKYAGFTDTLDNFRAMRTGFKVLTSKLRALFRGHPDLLSSLNIFLVERFVFTPAYDQRRMQGKPIINEDAIHFLNKVKN